MDGVRAHSQVLRSRCTGWFGSQCVKAAPARPEIVAEAVPSNAMGQLLGVTSAMRARPSQANAHRSSGLGSLANRRSRDNPDTGST